MKHIGAGGLTPVLGALVVIAVCVIALTIKAFA